MRDSGITGCMRTWGHEGLGGAKKEKGEEEGKMVQRMLQWAYVTLWAAWFRWGRIPLSRFVDLWRPKRRAHLPRFSSLEAFRRWWQSNTRWAPDPLFGIVDIFPSLEHAQWCLEERGLFQEDCDGLAYVGGYCVARVPGIQDVYLVTLAFDPFSYLPGRTLKERLLNIAHVITVFRQGDRWGVLSNQDVYLPRWNSFAEAVTQNPACEGRRILWYEVRDLSLQRKVARRVRDAGDIEGVVV